jgi:hypothetical protein
MGAAQSIDFGESMSEPSIDGENLSRTIIDSTGPVIFQRFSIRYEFASDAANAIVGAAPTVFARRTPERTWRTRPIALDAVMKPLRQPLVAYIKISP